MLNWHDISASLLGVQNDNFKFRECFWTTFTLSYKTATHHMPYLQQIVTYFVVYFKFTNSWTHVKINNSKEIKISSTQRGAILEDTKITMGWHLTLVTILFYFCWSKKYNVLKVYNLGTYILIKTLHLIIDVYIFHGSKSFLNGFVAFN